VCLRMKKPENRECSRKLPTWATRRAALVCALMLAIFALAEPRDLAAAIAPELQLGAEDRADLARIEAYLDGVRTVHSGFTQRSSNGEQAQGELYLARPGRLRIEYQPPVPVLVIADGTFLIYYDRNLEQVSHVPLASTPAGILLDKNISLTEGSLTVTGFERADGTIFVSVARADQPREGSIMLALNADPLQLQQWSVTDAQGIITVVTLIEPQFNVDLDRTLFVFHDPRQYLQRPSP
jgi:outer membrane lipoprotein-sorting protein